MKMETLDRSVMAGRFLQWVNEHGLDARSTSDSKILFSLEDIGFTVDSKVYGKNKDIVFIIKLGSYEATVWGSDWNSRFNTFKHGSLFFVLIDETEHYPRPEFRYKDNNKVCTTYDVDGNPKTKKEWYIVVGNREDAQGYLNLGAGYCIKNEKELEVISIEDASLVNAVCRMLGGEPQSAMGRGFAFDNMLIELRSIANA
jgi:hypothetical protein